MKTFTAILALFLAGFTLAAVLTSPAPAPAGDICEYYGMTQTLLTHGSLDLRTQDIQSLETTLNAPYYQQWYCYTKARNGQRYPIHFPAYSMIATPVRAILQALHVDPLKTFAVVNLIGTAIIALLIITQIITPDLGVLTITILIATSPLLSFITWPGPDLLTMMLLLYGILCVLVRKYRVAFFVLAVSSWASQPLVVPALFAGLLMITNQKDTHNLRSQLMGAAIGLAILSVPYIYNVTVFGTLTPWTTLPDWWTQTYGFGIPNIRAGKVIEQWFDLNIGVFWYAPVLTLSGLAALVYAARKHLLWLGMCIVTILTLLAYQTNPAWHYGTAGFGPSRHAIALIPFLIAAVAWNIRKKSLWMICVGLILVSQMSILSINNYIFPIFTNTLVHSPMAQYVLNHWPALYNPTPEIFVDRTNHTDLDHPTTAIYMFNGACKKAYALLPDLDRVQQTCGPLPTGIQGSIIHPDRDGVYINYE